jgi:hypothetical protein
MARGMRYLSGSDATARSTASARSRFAATSSGPGAESGTSRWSSPEAPPRCWKTAGRQAFSHFTAVPKVTRLSQLANRAGSRSWPRFRYARMKASWAMSSASVQLPAREYARPYTCPWYRATSSPYALVSPKRVRRTSSASSGPGIALPRSALSFARGGNPQCRSVPGPGGLHGTQSARPPPSCAAPCPRSPWQCPSAAEGAGPPHRQG